MIERWTDERLTQRRVGGIWAASSPVERIPSDATHVVIGIKPFRRKIVRSQGFDCLGWTRGLRRPGIFTPPNGLLPVEVDHGPIVPTAQDRRCG